MTVNSDNEVAGLKGIDIRSSILSLNNFDCGVSKMDRYLIHLAKSDTVKRISNTTIFTQSPKFDKVVGYYSLAASMVEITGAYDSKMFAEFPDSNDWAEQKVFYPAVKVNAFAVDKASQRQKVGTKMMLKLFLSLYVSQLVNNVAVSCLILESRSDPDVTDFYKQFGFEFIHKNYEETDPGQTLETYPMVLKFKTLCEIIDSTNIELPDNPYYTL